MDSPELAYLKAMHDKNKKFFAYTVLELADLHALLAVILNTIKADVVLRNDYDLKGFEQQLEEKIVESQTAFRTLAKEQLSPTDIFETGSENN